MEERARRDDAVGDDVDLVEGAHRAALSGLRRPAVTRRSRHGVELHSCASHHSLARLERDFMSKRPASDADFSASSRPRVAESTSGGASDTPRSSASEFQLAYVTDVEGNLAYFERWVALNSALIFYDASGALELERRTPYRLRRRRPDSAAGLRLRGSSSPASPPTAAPAGRQPRPQQISFTAELEADLRCDAARSAATGASNCRRSRAPGGGVEARLRTERLKTLSTTRSAARRRLSTDGPSSRCCRAAAWSATTRS